MTSACEVITQRTMIQCVRKDACEQRKETISTKGSMVANRLGCEQWLFQSPCFGQNKTVRRVIEVQRPCIMEWCHGGGDGMVKLTGKKKQLPKREKSQIPLNWWSVAFLSTFFGITIYILYCIYYIHRHSYVLVISKAFWCEPNGIATIPATTVGGSFLFIALLGVYPIPNQNWGLGLFLGFPSFGSRLSRIGVYRSAGVGIPAKLGFEATDPWAQFFSLHWVHLEKHSLMERCRKTYLRCSKTRCVMFFLQFQWLISAMLCPFLPSHCSNSQGAAKGKAVLCRGPPVFGRLQIWEMVNKY